MRLEVETIRSDCRHYRGDKPCEQNRLCDGCAHYQPYEGRVLVVKIGALGDVIRTLCILPEIRRRYPNGQVTWVTSKAAAGFIGNHPMIDRVVVLDALSAASLETERFDEMICLDKEAGPCGLAMRADAAIKKGVGWSEHGTPVPLNTEAVGYFHLGMSDELKFRGNRKGYPQLVYEAMGWAYNGERYELPLDQQASDAARHDLESKGWRRDKPTLAIHMGAGRVFANKMWPADRVVGLLSELRGRRDDLQAVLLGGEDELEAVRYTHAELPWTIASPTDGDAQRFIAVIDACDVLFSGDTLAMHLAIARQRGVVSYLGPTCEQEIDQFGLGEKLVASVPCAPCYKRKCDRGDVCLSAISTSDAADAVLRVLADRLGGENPNSNEMPRRYRLAG